MAPKPLTLAGWMGLRVRFMDLTDIEREGVVRMTIGDKLQVLIAHGCGKAGCPDKKDRWFGVSPENAEIVEG